MTTTTKLNSNAALAYPTTSGREDYVSYAQQASGQNGATRTGTAKYFLATDEKMLRIQDVIEQIANANVPVLVTGESGVGKEVVAKAIHKASNRRDKAFVAINCAALPPSLLEAELFGYEKGAFTGAHQRHAGKFEQAQSGTLLLDEITEMDPSLQAKLLRVLQEREIERLGGTGTIPVDVRIIATTNRNLAGSVESGQFRQDLYYRLHVINIEVPSLRDRPRDIELLANHFLALYSDQFNKPLLSFAPDAINKLMTYRWPGNVRELNNVIQRTSLLAHSQIITAKDIPVELGQEVSSDNWIASLPIGKPLSEVETQFILETLKFHEGNRTHAARTLDISLRTLRNKINEFTASGLHVTAASGGR
ncbi:MAG: sigma-54 dependent transcriptional regulator [Pseudomonadota bacterium]